MAQNQDLVSRLNSDLRDSSAVVGDSELLGYQITVVMRGHDDSVLIAHAAVANEAHLDEVRNAILEKTAEAFGEEQD